MILTLAALALAAPAETTEEIVVYGDPFARWDHTRWEVQTELLLPLGIELAKRDGTAIIAETVQLHAVLLCDKEASMGKKRLEVRCAIEAIGLQAISTRWSKPADQVKVAAVLDEIDARLTGMDVQLQTHAEGRVPNVQLEGIADSSDREDRQHDESLRAMVSQVMAAFHLQVPNQATRLGQFEEANPTLLRVPGLLPSAGRTRMVHAVGRMGDLQVVQTLGEGTASLPIPNMRPQNWMLCDPEDEMCTEREKAYPKGAMTDLQAVFELSASGVATYDRKTGIMTERIWQVTGEGRIVGASNTLPPYINRGRLTMLGKDDQRDVGPSRQLAPPGQPIEGLAAWVPLEEE